MAAHTLHSGEISLEPANLPHFIGPTPFLVQRPRTINHRDAHTAVSRNTKPYLQIFNFEILLLT